MNSHYDILIGGGGMIGTSLALALEPLGLRVAVVEAFAAQDASQPSFDDRSTALSRSTQHMFQAMGLWTEIRRASAAIDSIHVSEKGGFGFAHFDAADEKVEALGHVVINRVLGQVLRDALADVGSVDFYCPNRITDLSESESGVSVTLDDGKSLSAELLVCADGAKSELRSMLGIAVEFTDYEQSAVIGNLRAELAVDGRAFERFTAGGPIAMLPIAGERTAFVWVSDTSRAEELMSLDDEEFSDELLDAFGLRLGRFSRIGKRAIYPLSLSRATRLTSQRAVLVGNAAHGLHPVAAQGFNLGLRDVAALCDCIHSGFEDIPRMLETYADWREKDQRTLVRMTDGLVGLFGSDRATVRLGRKLGMLGFDLLPGIRQSFARQMMGLNGRLPRLSRGVSLERRAR